MVLAEVLGSDLEAAVRVVQAMPYGPVSSALDVPHLKRGTSTSKHAVLALLARELGRADVKLMVGYFEMSGDNTPGVGEALAEAGLCSVLEARVVMEIAGERVDATFPGGEVLDDSLREVQAEQMLTEEEALSHYDYEEKLRAWARERRLDAGLVWRARERAVADLARPHVLVLGGTGMLVGLCRQLADRGARVTAVGRRKRASQSNARLRFAAADWSEPRAFVRLVESLKTQRGLPTGVVAWVHESGLSALTSLARHLPDVPFLHVRGSASGRPDAHPSPLHGHPGGLREAILGFVADASGTSTRWLTDAEISEGVLHAWDDAKEPRFVVGTLDPWDQRP